jgi:hypothetical protein
MYCTSIARSKLFVWTTFTAYYNRIIQLLYNYSPNFICFCFIAEVAALHFVRRGVSLCEDCCRVGRGRTLPAFRKSAFLSETLFIFYESAWCRMPEENTVQKG